MSAVQKEAFPLAGMLSVVKFFCPIKPGQNLTKPHIYLSEHSADWSPKLVTETATAGVLRPASTREEGFSGITTRGYEDLYVVTVQGVNRTTADNFRRSIDAHARGLCKPIKREFVEFLESIKKGLQSHCPSIYGYRAPAKSGVGIGVPEMYKATHDAPGVFFCVLAFDHPFFSVAVIIRIAHEIMVGWMGAEKSAPVTLYAGYANPVQLTTSEIGVSGGGITSQYKEAATWLLPSPKNRLSSGVSIPASNPAISLYLLLLNQKPVLCYLTARAFLLPVFVQGTLMLSYFLVYGYGVNQRGLTIGINHKSRAESQESARAAAMLKAHDSGLSLIRITRVQEVAA